MLQQIIKEIEKQTLFSNEQRKILIRWFNKQNELIQVDIFKEQKEQYFKLRSKNLSSNTISLSAFFLAINKYYQKDKILQKKNKSHNLRYLKSVTEFAIKKNEEMRTNDVKEKLLNFPSFIFTMQKKGKSLRKIKKDLLNIYKFDVSHTSINKFIKEFKGEKNDY